MITKHWSDGMTARGELRIRAKIANVARELKERRNMSEEDLMLADVWLDLCRNMEIHIPQYSFPPHVKMQLVRCQCRDCKA